MLVPDNFRLEGSFWSDIRLAYGLLPVVSLLEKRGVDPGPLLHSSGIDRFGLIDPTYTIAIETELAFLRKAIDHLSESGSSLALANEYRLIGFSVLGLAMLASDTPLHLLKLLLSYPRLAWGAFDCALRKQGPLYEVRLCAPRALGAAEPFAAERDIGCAQVVFNEVKGGAFRFERVQFRHACPGQLSVYEEFFGCEVVFGAEHHSVFARAEDLESPLPQANAAMCEFYEAQCEEMSRSMERPFRFSDLVLRRLRHSEPLPELANLAATFFITPRTLQRRLAAEGLAYSKLLQDVREERANQLLDQTVLGMDAIAAALGYSDAVAFSHAYKGWTGEAPALRRKKRTM